MFFMKKFPVAMAITTIMISSSAFALEPVRDAGDGSWIAVSGTVVATAPKQFTLNFGDGTITVEMDGLKWYGDDRQAVLKGKQVIVQGRVDDDLLEQRSIEASSVYVKGLNTYFYASSADEEGELDVGSQAYPSPYLDGKRISLPGKVARIDGRVLVMKTGLGMVRVDTSEMDYNPVDDNGFQHIRVGDKIVVNGPMSEQFYRRKSLVAENLVTLHGES